MYVAFMLVCIHRTKENREYVYLKEKVPFYKQKGGDYPNRALKLANASGLCRPFCRLLISTLALLMCKGARGMNCAGGGGRWYDGVGVRPMPRPFECVAAGAVIEYGLLFCGCCCCCC